MDKFLNDWIKGLSKDKIKIGINWSGKSMTGFDLDAIEVSNNFKIHMSNI